MMTGPRIIPKAMTHDERYAAMQAFARELRLRGTADVYWLPGARRISVRATETHSGREVSGTQADAIPLGRYTRGAVRPKDFADELDDFLAGQGAAA